MTAQHDKPRVVLIDDNADFLRSTTAALTRLFSVTALNASQFASAEALAERVLAAEPEHLLLDLNLGAGYSSQEALRALVAKGALRDCDVRLISYGLGGQLGARAGAGTDSAQQVVTLYQTISAKVKGPLIRKPIAAFDLLAALLDVDPFPVPDYWETFPLPMRVLGRQRLADGTWLAPVVYANPAWIRPGVTPWQPPTTDFPDWLHVARTPTPQTRAGNPFDLHANGYVIRSFPLEAEGQAFLGQVVEHRSDSNTSKPLKEAIEEIFAVMHDAGFPVGLCFLVEPLLRPRDAPVRYESLDDPDVAAIESVLVLYRASRNHAEGLQTMLPLRRPLRGALHQRARDMLARLATNPKENLIYRIGTAADDKKAHDDDIRWWSQQLGYRTLCSDTIPDRLEVPVMAPALDPITGRAASRPQLAAVLSFSRVDLGGAEPGFSIDDRGERIAQDAVVPVMTLLTGLVERLQNALLQEQQARFIQTQVAIGDSDRAMQAIPDMALKKQKILQTLLQATGADHVVFQVMGDGPYLAYGGSVSRNDIAPLPNCVQQVRTQLHDDEFTVIKAWDRQAAEYCQDAKHATHVRNVRQRYEATDDMAAHEWATWTRDHAESVIAYPITVDERSIGVFVLYFETPWRIHPQLMPAIDTLAHRARWVVMAEQERLGWQQAMGHEMRSDLFAALNALKAMERAGTITLAQDPGTQKRWRRFQRNLHNATALAENWMDVLREVRQSERGPSFTAFEVLQDYLDLNRDHLDDHQVQPVWDTARDAVVWHTRLSYRPWFERVVQVLLNNAVKFGSSYVYAQDPAATAHLHLGVEHVAGDDRLTLILRNPGHMDATEYQHRFQTQAPPNTRKRDGAHVGLHAARKLVFAVGGDLRLENTTANAEPEACVEARLLWPCAIDQGEPK